MIFTRQLLTLAGAEGEVLEQAIRYLRIVFCGSLFVNLGQSTNMIMRGEGNGVLGAAFATMISQFVLMCMSFFYFLKKSDTVRIGKVKFEGRLVKPVLSVGVSAMLMQVMSMVQQTILYNTAAKWGGSEWQTILGAAIVQTGAPMLRVIFGAYICYGVLILSITFFQAIGKAGGASILALARQLVLFLPLVVILPHVADLGVKGVFYAQLITDSVVLLLAIILILEMMKLPDDFYVYKLKLAVVNAILLLMQRKDKRDSTDLYFSGTTGRKVQNVRRIINTNLEKEISIEELSEKVNLNRTTLQKYLKKCTASQ